MGTKLNTIDMKPVDSKFSNLKEEILDIESGISEAKQGITDNDTKISDINKSIGDINTNIANVKNDVNNIVVNTQTVTEVIEARQGYTDLKERLDYIESLDMFKQGLNLTTERQYEYDVDGYITKEIVSGDLDYSIVYEYDTNKNITKEDHFVKGVQIGTKIYEYDANGYINKIHSDNADVVDLVTSRGITKVISDRLTAIENLDIAAQLDQIKSSILIGPYDGKTLLDTVNTYSARIQTVENALAKSTNTNVDLMAIYSRLDALEMQVLGNKYSKEFITVDGVTDYKLDSPTTIEKTLVKVDGIELTPGSTEDYILLDDKMTLRVLVSLLDGCELTCDYY